MKKILVLMAAVALFGAASPANADFKMRFDVGNDGTFEVTVTDNGAGDLNPAIGAILYSAPPSPLLGAFTVSTTVGSSKPLLSSNTIDLASVNISGGAGTIAIELTDTGFAGVSLPLLLSVGGTTDGTVAFQAAGGVSNNEFDKSNAVNVPLQFFPPSTAFAGATTFGPTTANPFSMTIRSVITHTGPGQITSFDAELAAVPAPAGVLLAAAAAPLLGAGAWLRRRKAAVTA